MSARESLWEQAILPIESTIQEAIRNLNKVGIKIVLVVNPARELQGTISDGDIRRGLLKGFGLSSPIKIILIRGFTSRPQRSH